MQTREKVLIAALPLFLAIVMWFAVTSQAVTDWQNKDQELKDTAKEQLVLKSKIASLNKLKDDQKKLELDIEALRSAVPRSPDIDLLMIDLEKMCHESSMDLVSLKPPDKEKLKEITEGKKDQTELLDPSGKLSLGGKNKEAAVSAPKADDDKNKEKKEKKDKKDKKAKGKAKKEKPKPVLTPEQEAGLNTLLVECIVTGDYPSFVELMKKLECYQRVIGVTAIEIKLPEISENDKKKRKVDLNKDLQIGFLLTTYYLP